MDTSSTFLIILGDIIRWIVALLLLPVFLWLLFLFLAYPFEWLLMISTTWSFLFHLLFWLFFGSMIIGFFLFMSGSIAFLSTYVVRQTFAYSILFSTSLIIVMIVAIAGVWFNFIEFSWQALPFETFNKVLFTILILSLNSIVLATINASNE